MSKNEATKTDAVDMDVAATIEGEDDIKVGLGELLDDIPEERDCWEEANPGDPVEEMAESVIKLRKPGRREWVRLNRPSEFVVRLYVHQKKEEDIEKEHYYISSQLRIPSIRKELKGHRVLQYYSVKSGKFRLWPIGISEGNSWYETMDLFLQLDPEWFDRYDFKVIPDKDESCYTYKKRPSTTSVTWPEESTSQLLTQALGAHRVITSAEHPIYKELIEGEQVSVR